MITIELVGYHIPAKKNSKMLTRGKLITDPRKQKIMERIIRDIESQLLAVSQTTGLGISTELERHSWIASALFENDAWQFLPELHLKAERVEKGSEGALIQIEEI